MGEEQGDYEEGEYKYEGERSQSPDKRNAGESDGEVGNEESEYEEGELIGSPVIGSDDEPMRNRRPSPARSSSPTPGTNPYKGVMPAGGFGIQ